MPTAVKTANRPRERYITPIPGSNGFVVRVTRAGGSIYAPTLERAREARETRFRELFGEPYSEEAANRVAYSSNKGSDRRGVEFVTLRNGKAFWQVKYRVYPQGMPQGRLSIKKFFVSRWGYEGGYKEALLFKDRQDQLEKERNERQNPAQAGREDH